jgi:endonuclease III
VQVEDRRVAGPAVVHVEAGDLRVVFGHVQGRASYHHPGMADRRRVRTILDRLRREYGRPVLRPHRAPVDELMLTVLSQNTNDRNRDVAYARLRERFSSWAEVGAAPVEEVEDAIRPGGLAPTKAVRIKQILDALDEDDLAWMEDAPLGEARDYLCELPGVGRKTAACVLLFAYGQRDVPVDTHVSRVGTRLGLFRPKAPFEEMHDEMLAFTPRGQELELHVNLLRHGRRTCHARGPQCDECALLRMCPTGYDLRHPD